MSQNNKEIQVDKDNMNKDAKEYIPTNRRNKEKELPKVLYIEADSDEEEEKEEEEDEEEKIIKEGMDMIEKDLIEVEAIEEMVDDISEDEDKWLPMYRNCECCKGFVFNCKGKTCSELGKCYCKLKDECDRRLDKNND